MPLLLLPRSNTPSSNHRFNFSAPPAQTPIPLLQKQWALNLPLHQELTNSSSPLPLSLSNLKPKRNSLSAKTKACDSSIAKTRAMLRTRNGEGAGYLEPKQHDARRGVTVMLLRQKRKRQQGDDGSTLRHKLVPAFRVHRSQKERLKSSPGASESGWNPTTRNFLKQCSSESALEGPRSSSPLPCPALPCPAQRERVRERERLQRQRRRVDQRTRTVAGDEGESRMVS
jgi:hypothetical protein